MDFLKEYEKDSLEQKELSIQQKVYEEKLEKIYEFIQQLQQDQATPSSKSKEHRYDLENIRVLWVDDNPANNEAIMDVYRLQGIKFDLAINSSQALDFIAAKDYNLIISDMGRGGERDAGLKLLRGIKFRIANPPPFFIFASGNAVERFGEIARHEGATLVTDSIRELTLRMNDVLIKPTVVGIEKLDIRDESVDT